jgi:L-ribulose-5-phosphate 3-epimerase UlaE
MGKVEPSTQELFEKVEVPIPESDKRPSRLETERARRNMRIYREINYILGNGRYEAVPLGQR